MKKFLLIPTIAAMAAAPLTVLSGCVIHLNPQPTPPEPEPEPEPDVVCDEFGETPVMYYLYSLDFNYHINDTFIFKIDTLTIKTEEKTQPLERISIIDWGSDSKDFSIQWFLVDGEEVTSDPSTYTYDDMQQCITINPSFGARLRDASSVLGKVLLEEDALESMMYVYSAIES